MLSDVASTGVCHHVVRVTYRPKISGGGGGHSDIGHGDDDDLCAERQLIFLARLVDEPASTSRFTYPQALRPPRNGVHYCGTQSEWLSTGVALRSTTSE